ncbi:S-adenosyl-L-methionine-dependent methyltransferase [Choanephora cucurbitarum]|nr:S-adenosyl-L-methionine-dependent methyltransferase [Choanephora cucurbitarum]
MTGFMTVYLCFLQAVLEDGFHEFTCLFNNNDSILHLNYQPFLWFYTTHYNHDLDMYEQISSRFEPEFLLTHLDSIFSKFYTHYFLETTAQKHQKDHGQYYTPHTIIKFMWDKCATLPKLVEYIESDHMPRVYDPCLGMGSFLCEFLSRFITACRFSSVWSNPERLQKLIVHDIPHNVWGVEIDPFAYQLCKINMMVHLYPIFVRLKELNVALPPGSIGRLRLFCNDSLRMRIDSNPFAGPIPNKIDQFELYSLYLLRDATLMKFDFIVTNPPYMIRKTGYITQPDPAIYDDTSLGGRGLQAYLYFMWISLQRCDDHTGQVCLITPSQWIVLEFAQQIREWIWDNCKVLEMYEFEPYKVWPRVQTDSLVFRICKRENTLVDSAPTVYLRHSTKRITLNEMLEVYRNYDINQPELYPSIKSKVTIVDESNRELSTRNASFAFMLPSVSFLDELKEITKHLPRLCDGEIYRDVSKVTDTPLFWNRGPNTNPVYSLVVRTSWALKTFGVANYIKWLRPCFYWNGKTIASTAASGGKEGEFWKIRDPLRLSKKETSAAEAYWPYCRIDPEQPTLPFYSLIMVNKDDVDKLRTDYEKNGNQSDTAAIYLYLRDARNTLQASRTNVDAVYCQYNRSGTSEPVKIIHPVNCGYFTRSQPRTRFFVDRSKMAVTNQCIYFTIKPKYPWQDADYFVGMLNSTLLQFYFKVHCCYDQQGRMRFFGRLMAYIPFAPPPTDKFMQQFASFVQGATIARTWLYAFIRYIDTEQQLMGHIRSCVWQISREEIILLRTFHPPPNWTLRPDNSLSPLENENPDLLWIKEFVTERYEKSVARTKQADEIVLPLLKMASLFQFVLDRLVYHLYKIPESLQLEIEKDLNQTTLRNQWSSRDDLAIDGQNVDEFVERMFQIAKSFTTQPDNQPA